MGLLQPRTTGPKSPDWQVRRGSRLGKLECFGARMGCREGARKAAAADTGKVGDGLSQGCASV